MFTFFSGRSAAATTDCNNRFCPEALIFSVRRCKDLGAGICIGCSNALERRQKGLSYFYRKRLKTRIFVWCQQVKLH